MKVVSVSDTPAIKLQAQAKVEGKKLSGTPGGYHSLEKTAKKCHSSGLKELQARKTYKDLRLIHELYELMVKM